MITRNDNDDLIHEMYINADTLEERYKTGQASVHHQGLYASIMMQAGRWC